MLQRLDKGKTTFKAIEKYRYGLRKTVSKHLKRSWAPAKLITAVIINWV